MEQAAYFETELGRVYISSEVLRIFISGEVDKLKLFRPKKAKKVSGVDFGLLDDNSLNIESLEGNPTVDLKLEAKYGTQIYHESEKLRKSIKQLLKNVARIQVAAVNITVERIYVE